MQGRPGESHIVASPFETRALRAPQGEAIPMCGGFPHPEEGRRPVSKDEEIRAAPYAIALQGRRHAATGRGFCYKVAGIAEETA